LICFQLLAEW